MKSFILLAALTALPAFADPMPLTDFEHVAASQTNQILGPVGGRGDVLQRLVIVPETTAAGTVSIRDGLGDVKNVFVTGTLSDLHPIVIDLGMRSVSGDWTVTTGANVHVIGIGRFK